MGFAVACGFAPILSGLPRRFDPNDPTVWRWAATGPTIAGLRIDRHPPIDRLAALLAVGYQLRHGYNPVPDSRLPALARILAEDHLPGSGTIAYDAAGDPVVAGVLFDDGDFLTIDGVGPVRPGHPDAATATDRVARLIMAHAATDGGHRWVEFEGDETAVSLHAALAGLPCRLERELYVVADGP